MGANEFEEKYEKAQETNREYLDLFAKELEAAGISERTRNRHIFNVDVFLNDYLAWAEGFAMEDGYSQMNDYFGYYFIRKCMWSTPATIKSTTVSVQKFYQCMLRYGKITTEQYEFLCQTIKRNMADWQKICAQYNNPDMENPFEYFD